MGAGGHGEGTSVIDFGSVAFNVRDGQPIGDDGSLAIADHGTDHSD
jgi:hypothetical protein